MAAANESQGLKIAVAIFVALTVILCVTTYFGYSQYAQSEAKYQEESDKYRKATTELLNAQQQYADLRQKAGYPNIEDPAALKDAIKKSEDRLTARVNEYVAKVNQLVNEYKQAGGTDKKVEELNNAAAQLRDQIATEPNRTFQSALDRMTELMATIAEISTQLTLDNEALRRDVANNNTVNQAKLAEQAAAAEQANKGLNDETAKNEATRTELLNRVDALQTENSKQATQIAALQNDATRMKTEYEGEIEKLNRLVRELRVAGERTATVLGTPAGKITFVDYRQGEVRVDVNRRMGARPQMVFTVFDRDAPGIPTEKPKAVIELISVGDRDSIGRIDRAATAALATQIDPRSNRQIVPIRTGDLIYSPAWNPNDPQRFALIGKIDINRDGSDDRANLKRMIQAAGGVIAYDLPPTAIGNESGTLSADISIFVTDERDPIKPPPGSVSAAGDESAFEAKKADAIQKLTAAGVPRMPIGRLLSYLGYSYTPRGPAPGTVEAIDVETSRRLLNPRGRVGAPPDAATPPPPGEEPR